MAKSTIIYYRWPFLYQQCILLFNVIQNNKSVHQSFNMLNI